MNLMTTNKTFMTIHKTWIKLFYYEWKRILTHKFYLGTFLISIVYNWLILRTETILGISHTAPFSGWSFGVYLGHSIPLLLFVIAFFFYQIQYGTDRSVRVLTLATPTSPSCYLLIRSLAVLAAVLLLIAVTITEGILFLYSLFSAAVSIREAVAPVCFLYLPVLSLCFGFALGTLSMHPFYFWGSAVFLLLLEPITAFFLQNLSPVLAEALPLSLNSYLIRYPLTLADADTPFYLIKNIAVIRSIMFLFGSICIIFGIRNYSS